MNELPDQTPPSESLLTPPLADPNSAAPLPPPVTEQGSFTGDGREYFKIWVVNVALSIVTLGIYSAWAKVRRLQYFYRNTHLAGASFDYTGDPIAILRGRIIAGGLFALYSFAGALNPVFALVIFIAIAFAMPWMLSRSLRFRLQNSTYRGLAFRFTGSTKSAYWVFLGLPILTVLSLFTLGPFWHHRMKRYQFTNAHFGRMRFGSEPPVSDFYVTHVAALLIGGGIFFVLAALVTTMIGVTAALVGAGGGELSEAARGLLVGVAILVGLPIYLVGIMTIQAFTSGRVRNTVWNHTTLGTRSFASTLRTRRLVWIMLTNLLGTIATLGFYWPFAQVRLAKYYAETLSMTGPATFAEFEAAEGGDEQAIGEEVTDFFDFDVSF